MNPIALGIVGCGKIARDQHLRVLADCPAIRPVAVADPTAHHESLPSYIDIDAMLAAHPEISALALCMPPRFRAAAAHQAIAAGCHVLLEKPPCETVAEARELENLARDAGVTLFTAWHSQGAAGVAPAREWLADLTIRSVQVTWKEDVRVWHPGQPWIWQQGGFGVFDPGINALSILTAILPGQLHVADAQLTVPANCAAPIAAWLKLESDAGFGATAEFDFRQTGPQSWDIEIDTDRGTLHLSHGGNQLTIDGVAADLPPEAEYRALYARFAELIAAGAGEVHLAPLRLVEEAFAKGRLVAAEPFVENP